MSDRSDVASALEAAASAIGTLAESLRKTGEAGGFSSDRLLRPAEAADTFGVSRQFFYDHERKLSFVIRLPNGVLRVSEQGMLGWIARRRSEDVQQELAAHKRRRGL